MTTSNFIPSIIKSFPPDRLLLSPAQLVAYESDALTAYRQPPLAVLIPETQEEVIKAVRLCHEHSTPFVARGSGTSLSGGSLPVKNGLVIALNRLSRILRVEPQDRIAVVEPGVINLDISKAVSAYGLYYAPDPSSQLISTIGGNLAFNAGGAHCLKNGVTGNHILSIKAVLPDGEVVVLGEESQESVQADFTSLFVGSEGLFGIALEITVRLMPKPEHRQTVLASYPSLEDAGNAVAAIVAAGLLPGAIEIMDHLAIHAAEQAVQANYPKEAVALLIVELEGETHQVEDDFKVLMDVISNSGADHIQVARNETERMAIWKGRKSAFSAVGRLSPDYLVQDGVVPRSKLGAALSTIQKLAQKYDIRVANVFHAGDGNLHPLILYHGQKPGELERAKALSSDILHLCVDLGGSITGEHGVGMEKRGYLPVMFNEADISVMQRIHRSIDPHGLSNPGKMLLAKVETIPA
jgi:glycolate oxidase